MCGIYREGEKERERERERERDDRTDVTPANHYVFVCAFGFFSGEMARVLKPGGIACGMCGYRVRVVYAYM